MTRMRCTFFITSTVCLSLVAGCFTGPATPADNSDTQAVALDKNALSITYSTGDTSTFVTQSITLPTIGTNESRIEWTTSNSAVITATGDVIRPGFNSANISVLLTATITKGSASDTKQFSLYVIKEFVVNTGNTGILSDIEGNVYRTIAIGNQIWTTENLRTTKFNDGTAIPYTYGESQWSARYTAGFCHYACTDNADSIAKFGALYNWYAISSGNLAPTGWHVPSDAEWEILTNFLIANGYNWDGTTNGNKIAKSTTAKTDWESCSGAGAVGNNQTTNNRSGLALLPGGCRSSSGFFGQIGREAGWWSSTQNESATAYIRYLTNQSVDLSRVGFYDKRSGFSIRLVKN